MNDMAVIFVGRGHGLIAVRIPNQNALPIAINNPIKYSHPKMIVSRFEYIPEFLFCPEPIPKPLSNL